CLAFGSDRSRWARLGIRSTRSDGPDGRRAWAIAGNVHSRADSQVRTSVAVVGDAGGRCDAGADTGANFSPDQRQTRTGNQRGVSAENILDLCDSGRITSAGFHRLSAARVSLSENFGDES